jgi:hypothetical protein
MSFATAETPSGLLGRRRRDGARGVRARGLFLDPWQRVRADSNSLGERADGKWAAFEVAEVIPRQNGKGSTLEGRELTGLFAIDEERLIIHSAHEQATSSEHQRRLLELIESVPEFDQKVLRAPKGKGMEAIELRDGSRILFKTRTGGGGRGLTGDLIVLDEAMILPEATTAALVPTMAARSISGNPQLWYAGSAVDQQKTEHGVVLARVRDRAMKGAPRLMYVEWSARATTRRTSPSDVRNDPHVWAQANPGSGFGSRSSTSPTRRPARLGRASSRSSASGSATGRIAPMA